MKTQFEFNAETVEDLDGLRAQLYRYRKHLTHLPTVSVKLEGEAKKGGVLQADLYWGNLREGEILDGLRVWGNILGQEVDWYAPFPQGRIIVVEDNSEIYIDYGVNLC